MYKVYFLLRRYSVRTYFMVSDFIQSRVWLYFPPVTITTITINLTQILQLRTLAQAVLVHFQAFSPSFAICSKDFANRPTKKCIVCKFSYFIFFRKIVTISSAVSYLVLHTTHRSSLYFHFLYVFISRFFTLLKRSTSTNFVFSFYNNYFCISKPKSK